MAEHNANSTSDDLPPPYSLSTEGNYPTPVVTQGAIVSVSNQQSRQSDHTQASDFDRHRGQSNRCTGYYEDGQNHDGGSTNKAYTIGTENASNSFSGFIDILYQKKALPSSFMNNAAYKLGLLAYFCANLIYSIFTAAIQKEQSIYYPIYISIAFTGFACEVIKALLTLRKCLIPSSEAEDDTTHAQYLLSQAESQRADEQVLGYYQKGRRVFIDYIMSSLGELLIYPTLICILHEFINERAWQFDDEKTKYTFLMFVYSVIMDALYIKLYAIFLVIRVLRFTYVKYDELVRPTEVEWNRYFTPVYLSIPFAIATALTHWLMIGIIAITMYADNFTTEDENNNSSIPNTNDYNVTLITGYMIACSIYLPIASWIAYIIINKLWFYKVFSAINQIGTGRADRMPDGTTWNYKLFAFIKDPLAYATVVLLIVSSIAFSVVTYLPDYDNTDYELVLDARDTIKVLRFCFIVFFLLANIQAAIMFIITAIVVCVLTLWCCLKCIRTTNELTKLQQMERLAHK